MKTGEADVSIRIIATGVTRSFNLGAGDKEEKVTGARVKGVAVTASSGVNAGACDTGDEVIETCVSPPVGNAVGKAKGVNVGITVGPRVVPTVGLAVGSVVGLGVTGADVTGAPVVG